mgnify:FL=1
MTVERSPAAASLRAMIGVGKTLSPRGLGCRKGEKPLLGSRPIATTSDTAADILGKTTELATQGVITA